MAAIYTNIPFLKTTFNNIYPHVTSIVQPTGNNNADILAEIISLSGLQISPNLGIALIEEVQSNLAEDASRVFAVSGNDADMGEILNQRTIVARFHLSRPLDIDGFAVELRQLERTRATPNQSLFYRIKGHVARDSLPNQLNNTVNGIDFRFFLSYGGAHTRFTEAQHTNFVYGVEAHGGEQAAYAQIANHIAGKNRIQVESYFHAIGAAILGFMINRVERFPY